MRLALAAVLSAALIAPLSAAAAPGDPEPTARAWLALVDHGQYGDSWTAAGTLFKTRVAKASWVGKVGPVRGPLGAMVSRTFAKDTPATSLPGVPDGAYDLVQFNTVFAHKVSAMETVVLARQKDGWRVDGYFIR